MVTEEWQRVKGLLWSTLPGPGEPRTPEVLLGTPVYRGGY